MGSLLGLEQQLLPLDGGRRLPPPPVALAAVRGPTLLAQAALPKPGSDGRTRAPLDVTELRRGGGPAEAPNGGVSVSVMPMLP
mmetsp:Transcript_63243/g.135892  ORF Transcript_63243/g.135892 Transcript_63243/m.135892 type:complete len:83 (-) Transcript_63243:922-1170(-)